MKITKFGHSCLLVEEDGVRVLTDPGEWSTISDNLQNLDAILVTHEHADHYTVGNLKKLLDTNKDAQVITNSGVGAKLDEVGIAYQVIEDGQGIKIGRVEIEGEGTKHATIHGDFPGCHNTGYFIAGKLLHPGDSLYIPSRPVEILALPVVAPWMKLGEGIDYALTIKPKKSFPIHDANIKEPGTAHNLPKKILGEAGIDFQVLEIGKEYEF